jgi:hypothetical protein
MTVAARAVRPQIEEALSVEPVSRRTGRVEATFDDETSAAGGRIEAATLMSGLGRVRLVRHLVRAVGRVSSCCRARAHELDPGAGPGFAERPGPESVPGRWVGVQASTITGHGDGR